MPYIKSEHCIQAIRYFRWGLVQIFIEKADEVLVLDSNLNYESLPDYRSRFFYREKHKSYKKYYLHFWGACFV